MKKAAAVVAVSLAGGVGIGIGQGLVSGGQVPGLAWAAQEGAARLTSAAPRSDEEESVIRVARQARPAVVSVFQGRGSGSGILIRQDGVILTNAHVVGEAEKVGVQLASGQTLDGRVVGRDRSVDIAVVKIAGSDLPFLPLANSDALAVGQAAIAIGNPLGFERSVTTGVVSGVSRSGGPGSSGLYNEGFIQTDAAINPGNSGGPLLDTRGRVMGINSWIIRGSRGGGGAQGLGFAVPINVAKTVADQLLSTGRSWRALLGVEYNDVDPEMASAFHLPVAAGVVVSQVPDGSPASKAGVRKGDIITRIEDTAVTSGGDLRRVLRGRRPGDTVRLAIRHGEEARTVSVRLAAAPTVPAEGDDE